MASPHRRVEEHYAGAADGFELWSPRGNLHYGYWSRGTNPLNREAMLERMNEVVCDRIAASIGPSSRVVDLGCGLGATCQSVANRFADSKVVGLTNSTQQARSGSERLALAGVDDRVTLLRGDFRSVPLPDRSADAVYALECTAYAPTRSKRPLLDECYRLLQPGGTFVFADVYLKRDRRLPPVVRQLNRAWRRCGETEQVGAIDSVREAAVDGGFDDVSISDVSWNVAPSMAHIPFVVARLVAKKVLARSWLDAEERKFVAALVLSTILGLFKRYYGYYVVSGRRPEE